MVFLKAVNTIRRIFTLNLGQESDSVYRETLRAHLMTHSTVVKNLLSTQSLCKLLLRVKLMFGLKEDVQELYN
jgi:hypothetical protein